MKKYRTNSIHVKELVKKHILDSLNENGIKGLKRNIKALIYNNRTQREAIIDYIKGGGLKFTIIK